MSPQILQQRHNTPKKTASHIPNMKKQPKKDTQQTSNIESIRILQDELKRQFLLLQRQQRQKIKIKKQIQTVIQDYYSVLVDKRGLGKVITDDQLSNSYNFVKDLVLSISKDVQLGFEVLLHCKEQTAEELCALLVGMFYDNLSENDAYLKKNVKFAELLGRRISQEVGQTDENFMKKQKQIHFRKQSISNITKIIFKQFCKLQSIKQYFQMLTNRVLNKIPKSMKMNSTISRGSASGSELQPVSIIQLNQSQNISITRSISNSFISAHQHEIQVKIQEVVEEFKMDMIAKTELMPISLRVLVYYVKTQLQQFKGSKQQEVKFIWELLQDQYFAGFDNSNPKKWNHFKNSHFSQFVTRICQTIKKKSDLPFKQKLVQKIININKNKINKKEQQQKKKIVINGGCVSYRDLYFMFNVIKQNQKVLKNFSERVVNRANKILQMNPGYQFFKNFKNPSTSYLVFFELVYSQTLEKDYQSIYNSVYKQDKIKDMLKQILSDTNFHIIPYLQKQHKIKQVLKKVIDQQEIQGDGNFSLGALQHTPQFIMKIKYLAYLLQSADHTVNEEVMFSQMISQCLARQKKNLQLFQKNKIQLLQCYTTLKKAKNIVNNQRQAEKNIDFHLKIVKILDTMQINLCLTSPSVRPQKQKFTKVQNQSIIIQNGNNCQHQENIIEGLRYHANTVQEAILLFCDLKQVKHAIQTGKDTSKVSESLNILLQSFKSACKKNFHINVQQYNYFQNSVYKVIIRQIHQILIDNKEKTISQIEFQRLLKNLSFIRPNKIKISGIGRQNLSQLQQIWQIACRYLRSLNDKKSPIQKIQSLMEMIDIIKMSLRSKQKSEKQKQEVFDKNTIEAILAYCLIRSRPQKFILNLNFIQVFLSKNKIMSKQGVALQRLKNAAIMIKNKKIIQHLIVDQPQFQQQLFNSYTKNTLQTMKQNQRAVKNLAYI